MRIISVKCYEVDFPAKKMRSSCSFWHIWQIYSSFSIFCVIAIFLRLLTIVLIISNSHFHENI